MAKVKKARKKGTNPRAKGRRAEIAVRDILSSWTGLPFQRSPGSGAWATSNKRGDMVGDVVCEGANFAYSVEVKNHEGWNLEGFLSSDKSPIWGFWKQTQDQAKASGKIPLLLFTRNNHPIYCLAAREGCPGNLPGRHFVLQYPDDDNFLYVFLLSDLVKTDPKRWLK